MKKYIPVFGPQWLFNEASEDAVVVIHDGHGLCEWFADDMLNTDTGKIDRLVFRIACRRIEEVDEISE